MRWSFRIALLFVLMTFTSLPVVSTGDDRGIRVSVKTHEGKIIPLYQDSYALIIGNGDYTGGWDPLPGVWRDVRDVAAVLARRGFHVTLKRDLTKAQFDETFGEFVEMYGGNELNRLLVYYAGHGYTQKTATGEELGYLVMVDAPVPEKDPTGFRTARVDMLSLAKEAKKIRARHVLFMFDSCFTASILDLRERVFPEYITEDIVQPVREFITAGRDNEPLPAQSVFKQAFLDLLEGRDKEPLEDGYITGDELGMFLKNRVPRYNSSQHPQYGKIQDPGLEKGDFVLLAKAPRIIEPGSGSEPGGAPAGEEPRHPERAVTVSFTVAGKIQTDDPWTSGEERVNLWAKPMYRISFDTNGNPSDGRWDNGRGPVAAELWLDAGSLGFHWIGPDGWRHTPDDVRYWPIEKIGPDSWDQDGIRASLSPDGATFTARIPLEKLGYPKALDVSFMASAWGTTALDNLGPGAYSQPAWIAISETGYPETYTREDRKKDVEWPSQLTPVLKNNFDILRASVTIE